MAGRTITDVVLSGGQPVSDDMHVQVDAYKASRFVAPPAEGNAPPAGDPDAGPVEAGTAFGGEGQYRLDCPTDEPYQVHAVVWNVHVWEYFPVETGAQGAPGPPGPVGSEVPEYHLQQNAPSEHWPAQHNLGRHPGVVVIDSSGRTIDTEIEYVDDDLLISHSEGAFSGDLYAY